MTTRILVLDDDKVFADTLARSLVRRGYEVQAFYALDTAEAAFIEHPDIAIIDLKIDRDSGLVALERLKTLSPKSRALILTGYSSIPTAVEAIKLGAVNYLCKPANTDDILKALAMQPKETTAEITDKPLSVERLEWEHINRVLTEHQGNISATARALNMHRRTLQRKLLKRPVNQ